ncbi:hypothetical protein [Streptomyces venezuelae]|uniref:hypothetical protein n=1 Tax=Streptomyces venezuelae TaxID=54571 RepID=UPI0033327558
MHAPAAAAPCIARTIAHFVGQVLADTPANILRALRDEQVERARAVETVVALHHSASSVRP